MIQPKRLLYGLSLLSGSSASDSALLTAILEKVWEVGQAYVGDLRSYAPTSVMGVSVTWNATTDEITAASFGGASLASSFDVDGAFVAPAISGSIG